MEPSKQEKMFDLVAQWKQSGRTKKSFREEYHMSEESFRYWCKKYEKANPTVQQGSFIALEVLKGRPSRQEIEISYPNGVRIALQMHGGMNISMLRTLVTLI
jgi:hypothetical protein